MERIISDGNLEEMINDLKVQNPKLICKEGSPISRICTNPSCKVSLICDKSECKTCGYLAHPTCPSVSLERVTMMLNQRAQIYKELVWDVLAIDGQLMETIKESKKQLTEQYKIDQLQPKFQKIIDSMYTKNNSMTLSGNDAADLCAKLKVLNDTSKEMKTKALKTYQENIKKLINQMKGFKKELSDNFLKGSILKIKSNIIKEQDQQSSEQLEFLSKALDNPKQLKLLFRGSQNGFRTEDFHRYCDGIPDTLTLVRTQFGRTIGAYTHYPWVSENKVVNDPAKRAFLLSIDKKEKMEAQNGDNLITCSVSYGPTFGTNGESDLYISNKCNMNKNSYSFFPKNYNNKQRTYPLSQRSFEMFSGAKDHCLFRVLEYEVFQVIYEEEGSVRMADRNEDLYRFHKPIDA